MRITPITILAILLIACLVATPFILGEMRGFLKDIRDAWFKDWGSTSGEDQVGMGFTIEYEDGTIEEYAPDDTLFPFTVTYDQKPIKVVSAYLYYKLTYDQRPESVSGSYTWERFFDGDEVFTEFTREIVGNVPESGSWTMCQYSAGCVASRIEELDAGALKTHTIEWKGSVSLNVNWGTGLTSEEFQGYATGSITVEVKRSATMDVEVKPIASSVFGHPLT